MPLCGAAGARQSHQADKGRSCNTAASAAPCCARPESRLRLLTNKVMAGLHFAQFGGYPKRWLYDLASFVMIAAGLVHFCIKLRRKHAEQRKVGAPNLAVLVGLSLACIGLLWPNRLLPVSCPSAANGVCACSFWSGLPRWAWCYGGRRCAVGRTAGTALPRPAWRAKCAPRHAATRFEEVHSLCCLWWRVCCWPMAAWHASCWGMPRHFKLVSSVSLRRCCVGPYVWPAEGCWWAASPVAAGPGVGQCAR